MIVPLNFGASPLNAPPHDVAMYRLSGDSWTALENFYFLEVPELAQKFKGNFEHRFTDRGSRLDEIPEPAKCN